MKKKTVTCKVCGKEIAKSAKTCPDCGAKSETGTYNLGSITVDGWEMVTITV